LARVELSAHDLKECMEKQEPNLFLDTLVKRFKKQVEAQGILEDYKKHDFFMKKSIRRREKSKRAKIRAIKAMKKSKPRG